MPENADQTKKIAREAEEWTAKQKLLQMSEISLILDTYDDIFSDFDPRMLDRRSLSEDFLAEIKRATKEKRSGIIELNFLIPLEQRKSEKETMIRRRLRDHFKRHYDLIKKELGLARSKGFAMILIGLVLSILAAIFVYPNQGGGVLYNIILVLLEPAAWFTVWEGANRVFDASKDFSADREFYRKMSKCDIEFTPY